MKDMVLKKLLNINKENEINENDDEINKRKELHLKYDAKEYNKLSSNYSIKSKIKDKDTRKDGCIVKKSFENRYLADISIVASALIDTIFVYIEKTRKPAYFDAYQENMGLDENLDMVSETLIYAQIQRLVFENANAYSYKKEPPLKKYFDDDKTEIILRVLENYFLAVYEIFGVNFLYSSKAFRLMIEIFPKLYERGCSKKNLSYEFFLEEFEDIAYDIKYSGNEFLKDRELVLDKIYYLF